MQRIAITGVRGRLEEKASDAELCARLRISGRKALLALQRVQTAQALIALDAGRTQRLRDVMPGGGDHAG